MKKLAEMGFDLHMALLGVGLLMVVYGLSERELSVSSGGCAAIAFTYLSQRREGLKDSQDTIDDELSSAQTPPFAIPVSIQKRRQRHKTRDETQTGLLVDEMIQNGRYALLLRPEVIGNLSESQSMNLVEILEDEMAIIRSGEVQMVPNESLASSDESWKTAKTESYYLDRFAVTNEEYQLFVDDNGYANPEYWAEGLEDAIQQFVDQTGAHAPRFWSHGQHSVQFADHPVVGVCYYEACAYARWAGKRLPGGGEWVRAAAAPVAIATGRIQQRKYPWGEAIDETRANLWQSGIATTAPVSAYERGDTVQGVRQMAGNVWEWTADCFGGWTEVSHGRELEDELMAIRGGAFDTYFDSQACCLFQSGDQALARKHNIGFRCAVSAVDVAQSVSRKISEHTTR